MIEVQNLNFSYGGGKKVLNGLSFKVPKQTIFGFLGPNGSGKTTTLRIILDLLRPQGGQVLIDGSPFSRKEYKRYAQIGALIEEPSLYRHLSATENLKVLDCYYKVGRARIEEVLSLVKLSDAKNLKVKNFSLGMKQRLGLAQCILHNPDILILDEPLNGLDPEGISDFRQLLFGFRDEGKTILISSHLLSEVEKTCTDVCIIKEGSSLFSGKINDLRELLRDKIKVSLRCDQPDKAKQLLEEQKLAAVEVLANGLLTFEAPNEEMLQDVFKILVDQGLKVYEISKDKQNLEESFFKLMGHVK